MILLYAGTRNGANRRIASADSLRIDQGAIFGPGLA